MFLGVAGNSEVRKVTYKTCTLSKIDLASRFPNRPQKKAKFAKGRRKMSPPTDGTITASTHLPVLVEMSSW